MMNVWMIVPLDIIRYIKPLNVKSVMHLVLHAIHQPMIVRVVGILLGLNIFIMMINVL